MVQRTNETMEQPLPYPRDRLLDFLEQMVLIREFDEKTKEMLARDRIRGYCHWNIGEEASVVGAVAAMSAKDQMVTSYRDHGYALARGTAPGAVMAELFGRETGCAGGRGGSMHMVDIPRGFYGGYGIVGGQIPLAVGLALAADYQGDDRAVLGVLGDGATNIGAFHESLNLSQVWHLPVLWIVTNNQYGMGTSVEESSAEPDLYKRACAYRMHGEQVDVLPCVLIRQLAKFEVRQPGRQVARRVPRQRTQGHHVTQAHRAVRLAREPGSVAASHQHHVDELRRRRYGHLITEVMQEGQQPLEARCRYIQAPCNIAERGDRHRLRTQDRGKRGQTTRRHVDDAGQGVAVRRIAGQAEVGQDVAHLVPMLQVVRTETAARNMATL